MGYDLCFAWNWEYDADFAKLLESACRQQGVSLLEVTPVNLERVIQAARANELHCRVFFDRASDDDPAFLPLVEWAHRRHLHRINGYYRSHQAHDKAVSHYKLIRAGINTPYSIILPSYAEEPEPRPVDLTPLGSPFIVKPAHGGGGMGVVRGVSSWEQVLAARREVPEDQYLLQEHIEAAILEGRPAWFRVIACTREVYPFWWHPLTHRYTAITGDETNRLGLHPLWEITTTVGRVADLELFSTEIAVTTEGKFIVVDYINDPIDLRLQSKAADGIPDQTVAAIAERLAQFARRNAALTPR